MSNSTPLAELRSASKRYGPVTALDAVSVAVPAGQVLALLGANGAGKTTAIRLLMGLAEPTSGTATLFGMTPNSREARLRTGVMLQSGGVPATLQVREHVELFSAYYDNPLPIRETIAAAGLEGLENRKFGDLSGGQKQRLLFGLAICGRPDLLFLDEPTVGLDPESRRMIWKQIRLLQARGASVLLTTHYLEEADALASQVLLIDKGRVVTKGTPQALKEMAQSASLEDAFLKLTQPQEMMQ